MWRGRATPLTLPQARVRRAWGSCLPSAVWPGSRTLCALVCVCCSTTPPPRPEHPSQDAAPVTGRERPGPAPCGRRWAPGGAGVVQAAASVCTVSDLGSSQTTGHFGLVPGTSVSLLLSKVRWKCHHLSPGEQAGGWEMLEAERGPRSVRDCEGH